jgi:hypothetical protein
MAKYRKYQYFMTSPFKIGLPLLESIPDAEKFFVVNVIVELSGMHWSWWESDWVEVFHLEVNLQQDIANCIIRQVGLHHDQMVRVIMGKDRHSSKCLFEELKGDFTCFWPFKLLILAGQLVQWSGDGGIVSDDSSVKISEPQERLDLFDHGQSRPAKNCFYLHGIHGNPRRPDVEAQIFDFISIKNALLQFGMEIVLMQALQHQMHMILV